MLSRLARWTERLRPQPSPPSKTWLSRLSSGQAGSGQSRGQSSMCPATRRPGVWLRYTLLGFGVLGVTFWTVRYFRSGLDSPSDGLKLSLIAAFTAGLGFLGHRYIQVAYCQTEEESARSTFDRHLSDTHKKMQMAKEDARIKIEEMREDASEILTMKTEELWSRLRERYVTQALEEAFDFVTNIIDNLRDFGEIDKEEFDSPLFVLLALIKTVQDDLDQAWIESLPKKSQIDWDTFELHRRVSGHALSVYDASDEEDPTEQAKLLDIPNDTDIVYTYFKDNGDHVPKFILFLDHEIGSLILSIRGTHSLTDVIIDLICDDEEFLDGHAHRGIMRGSCKVLNEVKDILHQTLLKYPRYRLILTGHSLGAGTAELLTMVILKEKEKYVPKETEIQCVAIAPPPVYRTDSQVPKDMKDAINIYINNQDCVPRMCLGSIAKLLAMVRAVDKLNIEKRDQFKVFIGYDDDETKQNFARIQSVIQEIKQDRFPFLEHPGIINYLYKLKPVEGEGDDLSDKMCVVNQDSASFTRELIILERMILDHLKPYYIKAFDKCGIDTRKGKSG
ncbi:uncharacterized protein LOC131883499 isoform X2 [Tigriopus californicus]|uniref:uncharacterized protein LOC131883499 isoform X2 n=1 Tax=Tigriopus californicus TaxID=6832 RepID=UPI0027D9E50F|nr:uncharacterized protein LOC131883499 isoform X2 [Tigriopus californicus]